MWRTLVSGALVSISRALLVAASAGLLVLVMSGCQAPAPAPVEKTRLNKLATYYGRYISQHQGNSPANEQALKDFIKKLDPEINVDELFVSSRDNERVVVRYNLNTQSGGETVTVHEKTGVNGKRLVGLLTGEVREVDEAEFSVLMKKQS